jgi:hypothetical protein
VDFHLAVIFNETQLPETVHKKADSRARGADHLGQSFLADFWNDLLRRAFFAESRSSIRAKRFSLELKS